jgi:hypothetical protein
MGTHLDGNDLLLEQPCLLRFEGLLIRVGCKGVLLFPGHFELRRDLRVPERDGDEKRVSTGMGELQPPGIPSRLVELTFSLVIPIGSRTSLTSLLFNTCSEIFGGSVELSCPVVMCSTPAAIPMSIWCVEIWFAICETAMRPDEQNRWTVAMVALCAGWWKKTLSDTREGGGDQDRDMRGTNV